MKVKFLNGNIADMCADAIVTPTNKWLNEWKGSSSAIFEKAGRKDLKEACTEAVREYGPFPVTAAIPTYGFGVNAEEIIHAVVPRWIDGNTHEYENLYITYVNCLELADQSGCRSVAFPLLASGHSGFDLEIALEVAIKAIEDFHPLSVLKEVDIVLFGHRAVELVKKQGYYIGTVHKGMEHKQQKKNINIEKILDNIGKVYRFGKGFFKENPEVANIIAQVCIKVMEKRKTK